MLNSLLNLLFPVECSACSGKVENSNRFGVCYNCIKSLEIVNSYGCRYCGKPVQDVHLFCASCLDKKSNIETIYTACYYKDNIKKIIINFKYNERSYLGELLGKLLVDLYSIKFIGNSDMIIPIPLYPSKRKSRGYNQSEILANYFSKKLGIKLKVKLLKRIRQTEPQYNLTRAERFKNIRGAFLASSKVREKTVILIDDVSTTGATLQNSAKALKKAGAKKIYAIVVAHGK